MYDDLGLGLHENEADAGVPADFIDALNDCSQDGNCWAVRTAPVCSKCVVYVHVRAKEQGLVCVLGFGIKTPACKPGSCAALQQYHGYDVIVPRHEL